MDTDSVTRRLSRWGIVAYLLPIVVMLGHAGCSSDTSGTVETALGQSASTSTTELVGTVETTTSTTASTTTRPSDDEPSELNFFGGDDPEDFLMPDVLCMGLQEAQDEIQDHGVSFSRSEDATGENRFQLIDRNWVVVAQDPEPGTPFAEGEAVLQVVKWDEPHDCPD